MPGGRSPSRELLARLAVGAWLLTAAGDAGAVSPPPAAASGGMVVAAQHLASDVGAAILREGGNAIDAAVAVGYALAVVEPCCGNIGGGGFATIRLANGHEMTLDFRETAPAAAREAMFLDGDGNVMPRLSLDGYKAVAVPGTVLGLDTMLRRYGTMSRERVMAPAIALAESGFVLSVADVGLLTRFAESFAAEPNVAAIFLNDGRPWRPGERLVQKALAATLRTISAGGPDAFYKGPIADAVVAASAANGGILARQDFERFAVIETPPLRCSYRGYNLLAPPPPSSGGVALCQILAVLEAYPIAELGYHSAAGIHLMVEAMRHAFVDRNFLLGDPAFIANPVERLLSKDYAAEIRAKILPDKASNSKAVQAGVPPHEGDETTHYSVLDGNGNAVSVTYTINGAFGAKVIAGDTGFFLNDEMDDFTVKRGTANMFGLVQGKRNAIAPGKRPLSSMSPVIVTRYGKTVMVLGSPGGSRIITIALQTILNVIDHGMDIQEAVDAPRIHHQWMPDKVFAEPRALSPDTRRMLEEMGHTIEEQAPWGAAQAIFIPAAGLRGATPRGPAVPDSRLDVSPRPGIIHGASDNRRPAGAAAGP